MYALPKGFDAKPLIGRTLELICFTENQVFLHFDHKVSIEVESEISHDDSSGAGAKGFEVPLLQSDLMRLLGHVVVMASGNEEGTLTLEFDNGHVLKCVDQPHYEAYKLKIGDKVIIV